MLSSGPAPSVTAASRWADASAILPAGWGWVARPEHGLAGELHAQAYPHQDNVLTFVSKFLRQTSTRYLPTR